MPSSSVFQKHHSIPTTKSTGEFKVQEDEELQGKVSGKVPFFSKGSPGIR